MNIKREISNSLSLTLCIALALATAYAAYEPSPLAAADTDTFTVGASVTQEIAFRTTASNVTLAAIPGVTGGTSNGSTQVSVITNDSAGYTMDIQSSSSPALQGDVHGGTIPNYAPAAAGVPDYAWSVPANSAGFGYTVEASSSSDLDQAFKDDGSACDTGSNDAVDHCWINLSTSAQTIVNRTSGTPASGATTTVKFRLTINSNPSPAITADTYTATATLTATPN